MKSVPTVPESPLRNPHGSGGSQSGMLFGETAEAAAAVLDRPPGTRAQASSVRLAGLQ